jgi:hypothetical protein
MWRAKQTRFTIESTATDAVRVQRKASEFVELRQLLVTHYPGYVIPPLPGGVEKPFETIRAAQIARDLQLFLDELACHPILRCSELVHAFLTASDPALYAKSLDEFRARPAPREPKECPTMFGKTMICYNAELQHFCQKARHRFAALALDFKK